MPIYHILYNGRTETHSEAEARLLSEEKVPTIDFFSNKDALITRAYDQRSEKIAFHENGAPNQSTKNYA